MNLDEAIHYLKKTVNFSNVKGQKRINPELIPAKEVAKFEKAMQIVHKAIFDEEITNEEFNSQVGLT